MTNIQTNIAILLIATVLGGCAPALIVGTGTAASAAHDRRTLGSFVEDQNIELKAYDILTKNAVVHGESNISVTSYNGIVLLSGQTPSAETRAKAEELIKSIPKLRKIHNELDIAAPSSLGIRSSDTWVTTKVKTNLFKVKGHQDFDPSRVKVITENGTVFLMGLVNRVEADDVVEVVRNIGGVQRVVKVFEYTD